MKRNRIYTKVISRKIVVKFKKFNKRVLRYYVHSYSLNKSNFTFKKYYDIFFKTHHPFLKKINNFSNLNFNFKIFFKKMFLEQRGFLYGNVNKFLLNYNANEIDQYFYKFEYKKFIKNKHQINIKNITHLFKSNLFFYKEVEPALNFEYGELGSFFLKAQLNNQMLFSENTQITNNINFNFLFDVNVLYFLEIYALHKTIILNHICVNN